MCEERNDAKPHKSPHFSKIDFFEFEESDEDVEEHESFNEAKFDASNKFLEALGRSGRSPADREGDDLFHDFQYPTFEALPDCDLAAFLSNDEEILPFHESHVDPEEGFGRLILKNDIILDNFGSHWSGSGDDVRINMLDFRYLREMGRGEQGRIFLVNHSPSDTKMAIKEIPLLMTEVQMKNILIELEVLYKNKSPYIISFFGAFYTKSSVYFCMEVMDLGSLDDLIIALKASKKPYPFFPDDFLAAIIYSISSGLHFLSKTLKIIHRDVKPTNILLNSSGEVKLCDFGISGYLVKSAAKTYVGSMTYMAPERVRVNQVGLYTIQADVWSLGATLFELIMGAPLYAVSGFDSAFAHLMAISVEPCPNIPENLCSKAMSELIASFLSKSPDERPTFESLTKHPIMARVAEDPVRIRRAVTDFVNDYLIEIDLKPIQDV